MGVDVQVRDGKASPIFSSLIYLCLISCFLYDLHIFSFLFCIRADDIRFITGYTWAYLEFIGLIVTDIAAGRW